jgi:opacity protein-like surface antigen
MRFLPSLLLALAPARALAQSAPPPPTAPTTAAPTTAAPKRGAAEARTGFQMHFVPLTMVSFPFGEATRARADSLGGRYGWQWVPLELGLGAKIIDALYVGAYLNVGVGTEGGDLHTEGRCEAGNDAVDDVTCSAASVHVGIEARYTFTPGQRISGWVGYGAGFTSASQTISDAGRYSETSTAQGIDWARFSGGLDFRLSRGFGLGPFAIISLGRFTHQRTEINNIVTFSGDIDDPAFHAWASVGLRMVIFP